ncbi:C40 family peptidase, partial [Salininema proteolyticum]
KDIGEKGDTDDVKNPSGNGGGGNGGGSSSGGGGTGGGGGGGDDSGGGDSFEPDEQADSEAAEAARDFALAQDGKPYEWGGNGPDAFDCSGLMQQAWGEDKLPRTAQEQFNATERIDRDDLQPGDMLFFGEPGDVYHVAMYAGDGQMVHAANSDKGIVTQPVSEYVDEWNQPVAGYGRVQ